jgi:hypothetical protein
MLDKDYGSKGSVAKKKKKSVVVSLKGLGPNRKVTVTLANVTSDPDDGDRDVCKF